ncbi:hypothetical protein [Streptacidiphilus carbonis]|uniref:hypothetical protein n=1 Tax=Streptacidiphilus carbonis TaxID=105422 RepID=UPI0005A66342|nr:hypothetical protein [Streptacidiphilus carbonis]
MPSVIPQPCPGRCNAPWRRAEEIGDPHTLQPIPGEPVHCWACYSTAHTQLQQLPELLQAIYLEGLDGTHAKLVGTIGRVGLQSPPWPGQAARLFADGLGEGILILANDVREYMDEPVEDPDTTGVSVGRAIGTLVIHLRWLLAEHPCATESHGGRSGNPAWQIHGWHRSAEVFCKQDEQPAAKRLAACRSCGGPWLRSVNGVVECVDPGCRTVMTNDEYAAYVERLTAAAKFAGIAA